MMIAAAKLIFDFLMPTETAGNVSLYRPERDVIWLRWLFQRAVYGFYRYHLSGHDWKIEWEKRLDWPIGERSKHLSRHMPKMRADIVLENRHEGKRIVIDTKFKNIFGIGQYGRKRFHSSNIYQLYAYLLSQVSPDDPLSLHSEGILLYPVVDAAIDEWAEIQGHRFRFATVNLADSVAQIQKRLLSIIQPEVVTR